VFSCSFLLCGVLLLPPPAEVSGMFAQVLTADSVLEHHGLEIPDGCVAVLWIGPNRKSWYAAVLAALLRFFCLGLCMEPLFLEFSPPSAPPLLTLHFFLVSCVAGLS